MIKNDNLNVMFQIGNYRINILKFTYECQTWNTPSHAHSSNSYEIHFVPEGKGTLINAVMTCILIFSTPPVPILSINNIQIPMIQPMSIVFI